jgi:steroid delta-isomerase
MLAEMPTTEQVRAAVESYADLLGAGNRDKWLDLFAEDAVIVDPVPSDPHGGRDAISSFWSGLSGMADRIHVDQHALHVCGEQAALVYTLTLATAREGTAFDAVGIFTVGDQGLITSVRAYWNPAELRRVDPVELG